MSGMYKDAPAEFGKDVPQIGLVVSFPFFNSIKSWGEVQQIVIKLLTS